MKSLKFVSKKIQLAVLAIGFALPNLALADMMPSPPVPGSEKGDKGGNGGDEVRRYFILRGEEILQHLSKNTLVTQNFLKSEGVNVDQLRNYLNIYAIQTLETPLYDNTHSIVDSIGVPGKITLHSSSWEQHISELRNMDMSIFHELLRADGKNDDNFRISSQVTYPLQPVAGNSLYRSSYSHCTFAFENDEHVTDFTVQNNYFDMGVLGGTYAWKGASKFKKILETLNDKGFQESKNPKYKIRFSAEDLDRSTFLVSFIISDQNVELATSSQRVFFDTTVQIQSGDPLNRKIGRAVLKAVRDLPSCRDMQAQ